jgi:hypothetical protein
MIGGVGPETLEWTDSFFGPPRRLALIGESFQEPTWSRDGRSIYLVTRRLAEGGRGPAHQVDLLRIQADSGQVDVAAQLGPDSVERPGSFHGMSYSLDRDASELFSSMAVEGQPSAIVWLRPRTRETVDRFNPLDVAARIETVSLSPSGSQLAVRFGSSGSTCVGTCDLKQRLVIPVASDLASRMEWISLLVTTSRKMLASHLPTPSVDGRVVERPTLLPTPGELDPNREISFRLGRIGRIGRDLCLASGSSHESDSEAETFLAEARLFFEILCQDYHQALDSLDRLDGLTTSVDRRQRSLSLRAQLLIGTDLYESAQEAIAYLQEQENRLPAQIETTPAGVTITRNQDSQRGWARYLGSLLEARQKRRTTTPNNAEVPDAHELPLERPGGIPQGGGFIINPAADPDVRVMFRPAPAPRSAPARPDVPQRPAVRARGSNRLKRSIPK